MKGREEDLALSRELISYMLAYGKALQNKENVQFIKDKILKLLENVELDRLNSIYKLLEQVNQEVEARHDDPDRELRLRGLDNIRDILEAEINDRGLEEVADRKRSQESMQRFTASMVDDFKDLSNTLDDLADLNKPRAKGPFLATETERVLKKVERKLEYVEHEIERMVAEVPQTVTPVEPAKPTIVEPPKKESEKRPAVVSKQKTPSSKQKPKRVKTEEGFFETSPAYVERSAELARDNPLFSAETLSSVNSLQNSVDKLSSSLQTSSSEVEIAEVKEQKYPRLQQLSARLTIISAYLKSVKEHLNPLKPRIGFYNLTLKDRILGNLKTAADDAKENPIKYEMIKRSYDRLKKPSAEKTKLSRKEGGFFTKKAKVEKSKKKGEQKFYTDMVDPGVLEEMETQSKRKGKKSRRGGGGGKAPSTL